eukprot:5109814-Amphidinium_carterae.1
MCDCGAAVSVAPPSLAPHVNLLPTSGDTDDGIRVHCIKQCKGVARSSSAMCHAQSLAIKPWNENSCFVTVKPPPFKSWMVKSGRHYYIHVCIVEDHATSVTVSGHSDHEMCHSVKKSQMQHCRDVNEYFTSLTIAMRSVK